VLVRTDFDLREQCANIRAQVPLSSVAGKSLKLLRTGPEWKACCPFHDDRSPSFTIYADDSRFMCFGCGAEGDVLDFVMRLHRIGLAEALQMLGDGQVPVAPPYAKVSSCETRADRADEAVSLWQAAEEPEGSVAQAYLRMRGITIALPASLRSACLPLGRRSPMPALVAAVSTLDGRVGGIQRTFLSDDPIGKAPLPDGKVKFSLGRVLGGAIRLGHACRSLIVTEGLEDGLTLLQQLGRPVWVSAGAGMLPGMQLPDIVEAVVIGADNDPAGRAAADKAAHAFTIAGKRVRIMYPEQPFKDFNAWLVAQDGR
jgi:DNA primase